MRMRPCLIALFAAAFMASILLPGAIRAEKVSLGAGPLAPPAPVWIIGSYDDAGRANMMTASWAGVCASDPPCVTVSIRESRYSYGNIVRRGAFTVNVPAERHAAAAAFFGTVSGRDVDKLAATGLTAVRGDSVDAPVIAEFPLVIECRVVRTVEAGSHVMFIGEILDVRADREILGKNGRVDPAALGTFTFCAGNPHFWATGRSLGAIGDLQATIER